MTLPVASYTPPSFYADSSPAFSLDVTSSQTRTSYPADFEVFFKFIIEREGAKQAPESGGKWSQYGLMTTTVKYYFPKDVAYQVAINAGALSPEDAKAIYWKILNHKNAAEPHLSSKYPYIGNARQKLIYADMVVTLGMGDANRLYEKAAGDIKPYETADDALMP